MSRESSARPASRAAAIFGAAAGAGLVAGALAAILFGEYVLADQRNGRGQVGAYGALGIAGVCAAVALVPLARLRTGWSKVAAGHAVAGVWGWMGLAVFLAMGSDTVTNDLEFSVFLASAPPLVVWIVGAVWIVTGLRPVPGGADRIYQRLVATLVTVSVLTVGAISVTGAVTLLLGPSIGPPAWIEFVGGAGVVCFLGGLLLCGLAPFVSRRQQRAVQRRAETIPAGVKLSLHCPDCGVAGDFARGVSTCRGCRRALRIVIEEPRCGCGQVLFRLPGAACPECGVTVPDADRFAEGRWRREAVDSPALEPEPEPAADSDLERP